jgi:hypothetical protein
MRVTNSSHGNIAERSHPLNQSDPSSSAERIAAAAKDSDAALALLAEYSDPETSEHYRAELQCAALAHCEASLRENTQAPLSIPLAVLAAHAPNICDTSALKAQIEQNIFAQLPDAARLGDASGLLDATCPVPFAVMFAAAQAVSLFGNKVLSLSSHDWANLLAGLCPKPGGASAALIYAEPQWMLALLLQPVQGNMLCVLFDARAQSGTRDKPTASVQSVPENSSMVVENLRLALPEAEIVTRLLTSSLQNADGVLCLHVLAKTDQMYEQMLTSPVESIKIHNLTEPLTLLSADWLAKNPEQQTAFVVAQRAELLQMLVASDRDLASTSPAPSTLVPRLPISSAQGATTAISLPPELAKLTAGKNSFTSTDLRSFDQAVKKTAKAKTSVSAAGSSVGQAICQTIAATLPDITSRTQFAGFVATFVSNFSTPRNVLSNRIHKTAFVQLGDMLEAAARTTGGEIAKAQALLSAVDGWLRAPEHANSTKVYAVIALRLKLAAYAESDEVRLKMSPEHPDRSQAEALARSSARAGSTGA